MGSTIDSTNNDLNGARRRVILVMHLIVLALSCLLIVLITWDTLNNVSFLADSFYRNVQFWVCMFFLVDIFVEWSLSQNKLKYLGRHVAFILISIPYINIIHVLNISVPSELTFIIRLIPLIRTAYIFSIVTGMLSRNWISSLFSYYLIIFLSTIYFGSLMFFVEEHFINSSVTDFGQALWWAIMNITTCGSNIHAITPTGKIIAFLLSLEGLLLFPVFTVFLTDKFTPAANPSTATKVDKHAKTAD